MAKLTTARANVLRIKLQLDALLVRQLLPSIDYDSISPRLIYFGETAAGLEQMVEIRGGKSLARGSAVTALPRSDVS